MSEKDVFQAIALEYDGENAPIVTASGQGDIAEEIIRIAREHNIPLREDALLTEMLSELNLGEEIPPMLYRVIAEVIAYAYLISGKVPVNKRENKNGN
ncbi:EscU/YscU/HrcU family type III secretion system export apparatus switch protein [Methylophaga sp.]|uniref:EscU/YscU/HrcU family type III secretion system export apparatus switch protein n=1 Tax=Methylophaga sp. TaxID=2024840 RepID=UPI003A8FC208